MSIQAIVIGAFPAVFNDEVFSVVRVTGNGISVHHLAIGNGPHLIERLTMRIAVQGANIDPFMKTGINNATCRVRRITHKTVLAAFPWRGFYALVVAFDVLVECSPAAGKQDIIVSWQHEIDSLILSHRCDEYQSQREKSHRQKTIHVLQEIPVSSRLRVTASVAQSCASPFSLVRYPPNLARKGCRFSRRKRVCRFLVR